MTSYVVTGTQADVPTNNKLVVMKMSQLSRTLKEENSDDDDDDDEDDVDEDPILEHRSIRHMGGVNRIRAMPGEPSVVATWSDIGRVFLYDISNMTQQLETPGTPAYAAVVIARGR